MTSNELWMSLLAILTREDLQAFFDRMTPMGFFVTVSTLGLILGLILAFLLWYRRVVRYYAARELTGLLESKIESQYEAAKTIAERLLATESVHPDADVYSLKRASDSPNAAKPSAWAQVPQIDSTLAKELERHGIHGLADLQGLSAEDREVLEAKISFEGHQWDWSWTQTSATALALSSASAHNNDTTRSLDEISEPDSTSQSVPKPPDTVDGVNWSNIATIDPNLARELTAMEIRSVAALDSMPIPERGDFQRRLQSAGISWDWGQFASWKQQLPADILAGETAATSSQPESEAEAQPKAPIEINVPPTNGAEIDWSRIEGVDPRIASEFRVLGIATISQLEALVPDDRKKLAEWLATKDLSWDWNFLSPAKTICQNACRPVGAIGRFDKQPIRSPGES